MDNNIELKENQEIIFKELPLPEESDTERAENMQLLCDNFELILDNADLVIEKPEFFYIRYSWMIIGAAYIGAKYIPLGVLLKLWQSGSWIGKCPDCGGRSYIINAGGSPLSGSHSFNLVCQTCRDIIYCKQSGNFAELMKQAFDLCDRYSQKQKILRTRGPVFSWSKGLVGESVPDKILEDAVKPVSLETLVNELKKLGQGG